MSSVMVDVAAAGRSGPQRLARERFIWWFRVAALCFLVVQTAMEAGDVAVLSWGVAALFAASLVGTGLALRTGVASRARWVGVGAMATDVVVVASVLANNTTDPAEPAYLVGVLAMLEATIRWGRWGGVIGGLVAGASAGAWTVLVSHETVGRYDVDYATMRAGIIVVLGIVLGSMVRQLSQQHEALQGILDTTRDLIVTLDERGTVLSVNAASTHLLGFSPEEMIGHRYWHFFHPDDVQPLTDRTLALPTSTPVLFERRVICRDGAVRWLELNAVAVPGSGTIHVSARDVSERRQARQRLEESEQRFRSLFEHNTDAVYALDLQGRFTMVNPAVVRLSGYRSGELIGASFGRLMVPDALEATTGHFDRAAAGEAQTYETAVLDRAGRRIDLDVTNVPIVVDEEVVGVFGVAKDVTERRYLERQLGHQATHDALTGLPNRARLELALDAASTDGAARTLLFIDLDRFKLVNDSLGHRSGDELLVAAVERLRRHVRGGDLLARWAGDEFCVLLAPGTTHDLALVVADRLRSVLSEPFAVAGRDVRLSASIGLATAVAGDVERLVQIADLAMYEAKRAGRDRVAVYDGAALPPALTQLDLEVELTASLDRHELVVHYQPIVDTASGAIRAVEALARWPRADGTLRLPAEFVPVAEESGLVRLLTRFVVRDACSQLVRWDALGAAGGGALQAWVNVSVADLESRTFASEVREALEGAGVDAARLVLEVTETMLMRDVDQVDCTIDELSVLGVSLAIDDFGTGYSSLSQLHRLKVAACKIDREFVTQAPERGPDSVILHALVDVGTAFGLPVVAEGIERPEELAAAVAAGCPLAQGYLLGAPVAAADLDDDLRTGHVPLPGRPGRRAEVRSGR